MHVISINLLNNGVDCHMAMHCPLQPESAAPWPPPPPPLPRLLDEPSPWMLFIVVFILMLIFKYIKLTN